MKYPSLVSSSLGDQGGSAYYRVLMPLLLSDANGLIQFRMPPQMYFFPLEVIKAMRPDAMLFHRSHTEAQRKYINTMAHETDVMLVYTIDDWLGKVPKDSPHYATMPKSADKDVQKAIKLCHKLIVTNDVLAGVYGYKKDVTIIPNYLPQVVWNTVYKQYVRTPDNNRVPRIGWSGGIGHPGDLKLLHEIADILGDKVKWVFLGDTPPGFDPSNAEIRQPVNVAEYPKALYSLDLDLALAPLLDNDFNRAKSNLRILEYAACAYPVIASNIKTYQGTPATLLNNNASWWANEILKKLADREELRAEGKLMQDWLWANYKLEDHLEEYGNVLSPSGVSFKPSIPQQEDVIDIVITTHNHTETVKRCVDSVLETIPNIKAKVELVISDNASTEEELHSYLDTLGSSDKITILKSEIDEGYVNSVNKALQVHPNRDAIILNSDTYVTGDWVDRLKEVSDTNPRIASVTPFTNNGTICSYPNPAGNTLETGLVKLYDTVVQTITVNQLVEIPTPVGFCTYLKRAALSDLGLFDPHGFTRGYGEENDWALRGHKRMWSHMLAHNVYVGHEGSVTFGAEKQKLLENSAKTLITRWQHYGKMIDEWLKANTLAGLRQQIDLNAIAKISEYQPRTLYIAHGYGGGLETYLQSQIANDPTAIILRSDPQAPSMIKLEVAGEKYYNLPLISSRMTSMTFLQDMFSKFNVERISVQTTFGYDYNFANWIISLSELLNVPYEIMLHDYWNICPRLRLVDKVSYCGEPAVEVCNKCVIENGSALGAMDVGEWRKMNHKLLKRAEKLKAPSHDLATRMKKHFHDLEIEVIPHESILEIGTGVPYVEGTELRIAVIGSISPDKGSLIVRDCAAYALENKLPVKFIVFGDLIDNSAILTMIPPTQNLSIQGAYEEGNIKTLLQLNKCHYSLFPAVWPETYSYTLSHAFRAGLWPIAFDIGAIPERIKEKNFGTVLPFEMSKDPAKVMEAIMNLATIHSKN